MFKPIIEFAHSIFITIEMITVVQSDQTMAITAQTFQIVNMIVVAISIAMMDI